jgi:hypothetical protein
VVVDCVTPPAVVHGARLPTVSSNPPLISRVVQGQQG